MSVLAPKRETDLKELWSINTLDLKTYTQLSLNGNRSIIPQSYRK